MAPCKKAPLKFYLHFHTSEKFLVKTFSFIMREEYKNILDEMVINEHVINQSTDGTKLLMYLYVHNVLSYQEKHELNQMGPTNSIQHLMKHVLKSREDVALNYFLNSLKEANYEDAYSWLNGKLDNLILLRKSDPRNNNIPWNNLKVHYKERLEFVESYWRQFGVKGILNMDTFYNHNIVISNEKYKQIHEKIENFDNLFSTDYKRFIVMAEAGYGKSTFVHEMARQWVKDDKEWTRKFEFLFLFCLTEVNEKESESLENLLSVCLCSYDASVVYNWLKCGNMSKVLFIFDGLDELRQNFCQEVNELIFGGKVNLATVIITSRQCDKLAEIKKDTHRKLYIELKGYTDKGVIQQLEKFSIPIDRMKNDLKNHLKIPLFNTIFCITHSKSRLACTNMCSSIYSFVNFAINRYRNSNQNFTVLCEEQLLLTLGQAAQNKFSFIQNVEIPYPNVSSDHLFWAINSGLLHNSSVKKDLVFAHQTIAEYCAAYFWCKTEHLAIKKCVRRFRHDAKVSLNEPPNAQIEYLQPFSQFICLLCPEFKEDLWQKFERYIPIFNEYQNLPDKPYTEGKLEFSYHSVDDQITIMNKLDFQENSELDLINGQFEPEKLFKTIRNLKKLHLTNCTFNTEAEEFFIHFTNVQSLTFDSCNFYDLNIVYNEFHPPRSSHLPLQELKMINCSVGIETFLSFTMKYSTLIKSFELWTYSFCNLREQKHSKNVNIENVVDDCGIDWISELQNNKRLCISIEDCILRFAYPFTLIPIIKAFKIMQNIKKLTLDVLHKLTKLEANALADLLEVGLLSLEYINLNIKMENQEDCEPVLKNLSKLSALTSLHLWNVYFTTDTLNYLADIFNKLKLEECELKYQDIFFEEQIINSINSCLSLKNITFWLTNIEDEEDREEDEEDTEEDEEDTEEDTEEDEEEGEEDEEDREEGEEDREEDREDIDEDEEGGEHDKHEKDGEQIINSTNWCMSEDSNFELFKKRIENKDRQLKIKNIVVL